MMVNFGGEFLQAEITSGSRPSARMMTFDYHALKDLGLDLATERQRRVLR